MQPGTVALQAVRRQADSPAVSASCVLPFDPILREAYCKAFTARSLPGRRRAAQSKEGLMARSSRESAVKARPAAAGGGNGKSLRNGKSAADARKELLERAGRNRDGASQWRSDPLADAQAARRVADLAQAHAAEPSRRDLAADVEKIPGAGAPLTDEALALVETQGALRAYFDLLAAKATLAFAADPEERARLLSLLPRADERRHLRRSADQVPAA